MVIRPNGTLKFVLGHFIFLIFFLSFKDFIYFQTEGKEGERERNINVWLPLAQPLLGTRPTTQACALTGN